MRKVTSIRGLTPSQRRFLSRGDLDPEVAADVHRARKKLRGEGLDISPDAAQKLMTNLQRKKRRHQPSLSYRDGDPSFRDSHVAMSAGRAS